MLNLDLRDKKDRKVEGGLVGKGKGTSWEEREGNI
jgi:hypothetical protein